MRKKEFEEYLKDRNDFAISGRYEDYEKFCKKYNMSQAPNNEIYEIMLHKIRANITEGIPFKMIEDSKKWLLEHGYNINF